MSQVLTAPSVRRLAKEHEIDLEDVTPSGPGNRLLKQDLLDYIRVQAEHKMQSAAHGPAVVETATPSDGKSSEVVKAAYLEYDTEVPLTGRTSISGFARNLKCVFSLCVQCVAMQKMMVKSMNAALQIPHFGYADEVNGPSIVARSWSLTSLCD